MSVAPETPVPDTGMDMDMEMKEMSMMDMAMHPGNLAFLAIAAEMAIATGFEVFRYKSVFAVPLYYKDGAYIYLNGYGLNTWKWTNRIEQFAYFIAGAYLTITQLLSMLGIMAEINVMAWMYLGLADMAVSLIYAGAYMYVYNTYYSLE